MGLHRFDLNAPPPETFSLGQARCGERLQVVDLKDDSPAAVRLRELGFCESAEVCKVTDRGACICVLMGVRVAIGPDLASQVVVKRLRK